MAVAVGSRVPSGPAGPYPAAVTIVAVDVDYRADRVVTAAVGFAAWTDAAATIERVATSMTPPAPYQPGSFYQRELPFLLAILAEVAAHAPGLVLTAIVVDGYVTLDGAAPGLGAHLHAAHPEHPPVVGVAKRPWRGGAAGIAVVRGTSHAPLYVTAIGVDVDEAARQVGAMHGPHRTPTLLKRVDRLARDL